MKEVFHALQAQLQIPAGVTLRAEKFSSQIAISSERLVPLAIVGRRLLRRQ